MACGGGVIFPSKDSESTTVANLVMTRSIEQIDESKTQSISARNSKLLLSLIIPTSIKLLLFEISLNFMSVAFSFHHAEIFHRLLALTANIKLIPEV